MSRPSQAGAVLRLLCLAAMLGLMWVLGCHRRQVQPLYLFDGESGTVLAWDDVEEVFEAARDHKPPPKADRKIESGQFHPAADPGPGRRR